LPLNGQGNLFFRIVFRKWNWTFSAEPKNTLSFTSIHPIQFQATGFRHTSSFLSCFTFIIQKKKDNRVSNKQFRQCWRNGYSDGTAGQADLKSKWLSNNLTSHSADRMVHNSLSTI
jgi:hypothetical protein